MPGFASCFLDISRLWGLAATLVAFSTSLIGCVVGCLIKARECRRLRLENDKLDLEIDLLKAEVARKGVEIEIASGEKLEALLRDRLVFSKCRTPAKASWLTRENDPDDQLSDEDFLAARKMVRNAMIKIVAVGVAVACSLFAIVLWW